MPVKHLDEHVDATKVGALLCFQERKFRTLPELSTGSGAAALPSLELGRHAPIVKAAYKATSPKT